MCVGAQWLFKRSSDRCSALIFKRYLSCKKPIADENENAAADEIKIITMMRRTWFREKNRPERDQLIDCQIIRATVESIITVSPISSATSNEFQVHRFHLSRFAITTDTQHMHAHTYIHAPSHSIVIVAREPSNDLSLLVIRDISIYTAISFQLYPPRSATTIYGFYVSRSRSTPGLYTFLRDIPRRSYHTPSMYTWHASFIHTDPPFLSLLFTHTTIPSYCTV